jgi:hypothetical protein
MHLIGTEKALLRGVKIVMKYSIYYGLLICTVIRRDIG